MGENVKTGAAVSEETPKPCPFCNIAVEVLPGWSVVEHPRTDCILSLLQFSAWHWNRRPSVSPPTPTKFDVLTARESLARIKAFLVEIQSAQDWNETRYVAANLMAEYQIVADRIERFAASVSPPTSATTFTFAPPGKYTVTAQCARPDRSPEMLADPLFEIFWFFYSRWVDWRCRSSGHTCRNGLDTPYRGARVWLCGRCGEPFTASSGGIMHEMARRAAPDANQEKP